MQEPPSEVDGAATINEVGSVVVQTEAGEPVAGGTVEIQTDTRSSRDANRVADVAVTTAMEAVGTFAAAVPAESTTMSNTNFADDEVDVDNDRTDPDIKSLAQVDNFAIPSPDDAMNTQHDASASAIMAERSAVAESVEATMTSALSGTVYGDEFEDDEECNAYDADALTKANIAMGDEAHADPEAVAATCETYDEDEFDANEEEPDYEATAAPSALPAQPSPPAKEEANESALPPPAPECLPESSPPVAMEASDAGYGDATFDADDHGCANGHDEHSMQVIVRQSALGYVEADANGDGMLDFNDFANLVRNREEGDHSDDELRGRFAELDEDGSGQVGVTEFLQFSLRDALSRSSQRVIDLFRVWDEDKSGSVDNDEFYKATRALGFDVTRDVTDGLFNCLDKDGSGALEYKELKQALSTGAGTEATKNRLKLPSDRSRGAKLTAKAVNSNYVPMRATVLPPMVKLVASDERSVEEQLRDILGEHSVRLIDLFRDWDDDGNGALCKKEFRQAVAALGYEATVKDIDALFDDIDDDANGWIEFSELKMSLSPKGIREARKRAFDRREVRTNALREKKAKETEAEVDRLLAEQAAEQASAPGGEVANVDCIPPNMPPSQIAVKKATAESVERQMVERATEGSSMQRTDVAAAQFAIRPVSRQPAPPTSRTPNARTPRSRGDLAFVLAPPLRTAFTPKATIESARRTLGDLGDWERLRRQERIDSAQRRSGLGMNAPPMKLATAFANRRHFGLSLRGIQKQKQAPLLDLSQTTRLYGSADRVLQEAAFLSLDLKELAAPLPITIAQHLPGTHRPFSRELSSCFVEPKVDAAGVLAPVAPPPRTARPFYRRKECIEHTVRAREPVAPDAGRLPLNWSDLCAQREAQIEGLINLALRLQAYGRGQVGHQASVRRAAAEAIASLRRASLAIVEAVGVWREASDAAQVLRYRKTANLEERRRRLMANKAAKRGSDMVMSARRPAAHGPRGADEANLTSSSYGYGGNFGVAPQLVASGASAIGSTHLTASGTSVGSGSGSALHGYLRPAVPTALFSNYSLRFACNPPTECGRTREAPGLWDGFNYLLKMVTDVWRLPLPTMSDPFALRWFAGTAFDVTLTNSVSECNRMMHAETLLKRLFSREQTTAMEAVESTIALRRVRPTSSTSGSTCADGQPSLEPRRIEAEAEAANWKVLSQVLYPQGAATFARLKREQWKAVQQASRLQSFIRHAQFSRRVAARVRAKHDKAARIVQHHYRNRFHLTAGGQAFAAAVEQRLHEKRAEEARLRAQRRAETEARIEAEMGVQQRRAQRTARSKALAQALKERSAVDILQRAVRRCLGALIKRRLRMKRAKFLRSFTEDATGHSERMLRALQKRVRSWIMDNALYMQCYEDHRRGLHEAMTQPKFEVIEADVQAQLEALAPKLAAAKSALLPKEAAAEMECRVRLRLAETHGELMVLRNEYSPHNSSVVSRTLSGGPEQHRRNLLANAQATLETLRKRLENEVRDHCALIAQSYQSESAVSTAREMLDHHTALLPWILGQRFVLAEHARHSKVAIASREMAIEEILDETLVGSA